MKSQKKAIQQYFHAELFAFVSKTLMYVHSNESYWAMISWSVVNYAGQGDSNFYVCRWNSKV